MNNKALYSVTYGLYIVSTAVEGKAAACVVNTLQQVTSQPARLSVTINKDNYTAQAIQKSGLFAATVMAQDIELDTIGKFGFKSSVDTDKFDGETASVDSNGIPYLTQHMTAMYSCRVIKSTDVGSHITFVGEIIDADVLCDEPVLTYAYYQTVKKGGTPKNAPSYKEDAPSMGGYRCSVCGYILESGTIPEDFKCPICSQGADKLIKL